MNSTTGNGSIESSSCFSVTASKIGQIISFSVILAISFVGNSLIVIIVCKTPTLKKPINYFIANMAMSDLLFSIPWHLSELQYDNSWPIGGQFRLALCKIVLFFGHVSIAVSVQNLILIAVDRFGAVVFPLRSPLIRSKLSPFFILATWIVAVAFSSSYLFFAFDLFKYQGEPGKSIWRVVVLYWLYSSFLYSVYIPSCAVVSHSLLHHSYQAQDTSTPG